MTVGIVGAGQLGRMLALAGYPLGLDFLCLDPARDAPAGKVAPLLHGAFTDAALLRQLARRCEVVTFDWENVSVAAFRAISQSSRFCAAVASMLLRLCVMESCRISDADFVAMRWLRKSKAELVLAPENSMNLVAYSAFGANVRGI